MGDLNESINQWDKLSRFLPELEALLPWNVKPLLKAASAAVVPKNC